MVYITGYNEEKTVAAKIVIALHWGTDTLSDRNVNLRHVFYLW
jgi:hypothetical protein